MLEQTLWALQIIVSASKLCSLEEHCGFSHTVIIIADPAVARQITVKDFNKFHDRFIPNLDKPLKSGTRAEADRVSMVVAQ